MEILSKVIALLGLLTMVSAFGSSDDRFIKKYAMMKIYESCFGSEVVKEIRREMKLACAKCAMSGEKVIPPSPPQSPMYVGRLPPMGVMGFNQIKGGEISSDNNQNEIPSGQIGPINLPLQPQEQPVVDKLQQAIMSLYLQQQQQQQQPIPEYPIQPYRNAPYFPFPQQVVNPFLQQYPQPQPYMPYYQFPVFRNRMSRDMDFRNRVEILTARTSGKVRNVTCVMQELGYLDQNLEPNYQKIAERIENLPVASELKSDMQEGLQFCEKFASCVPETRKENSPLSREVIKPTLFFRCYKHKKLEACIMKDIRERFTAEEDMESDSDFRSMSRVGKAIKGEGSSPQANAEDYDDVALSIYDFLYGGNDMDLDSML